MNDTKWQKQLHSGSVLQNSWLCTELRQKKSQQFLSIVDDLVLLFEKYAYEAKPARWI